MTKEDLKSSGILTLKNLKSRELGLLILSYNKLLSQSDFAKKEQLISSKFKFTSPQDFLKVDYVLSCLAVSDRSIQEAYIKGKKLGDIDAILNIHNVVVESELVEPSSKENIRTARKIAEQNESVLTDAEKYKDEQIQFEYLLSCLCDEEVFNNFCKNLPKNLKESAKKSLTDRFNSSVQDFCSRQEKFISQFVACQVKEDARLLSYKAF